jgi:hypothetical protein
MTTNEEFYDTEIAPILKDLCAKCMAREMSFVASVEYDPLNAGRGRTEFQMPTKPVLLTSCGQLLVHWAARCNGNVDSLIMAIDKHAREYGHSSIYLQQLGNKNVQYSGNEVAAIMITTPK